MSGKAEGPTLFASQATESAWEWARNRRYLFTTPRKDISSAVVLGIIGGALRYGLGDAGWRSTTIVGVLIALVGAVLLPHLETLYWWRRRDSILLEEREAELAELKSAQTSAAPRSVSPHLDKPSASPVLVADKTGWARLRITNKGAGAVFSASVQTHNLTAGAVEGGLVSAKWQEVETPTQRIARDDTRVLWLATLSSLGAPSVNGWRIHRAGGPDLGGVDAEDVIDVTVVAEPDLEAPCQLRVVLRADPTKCELIRLPIETVAPQDRSTIEHQPMRLVLPEVIQKNLSDYPVMVELRVDGRATWVQIESAVYGCEDSFRDVREAVLEHINDGRIELLVNNRTLGGDPCKGSPKELVIEYSVGEGPPITVRKKEHDWLRIP